MKKFCNFTIQITNYEKHKTNQLNSRDDYASHHHDEQL